MTEEEQIDQDYPIAVGVRTSIISCGVHQLFSLFGRDVVENLKQVAKREPRIYNSDWPYNHATIARVRKDSRLKKNRDYYFADAAFYIFSDVVGQRNYTNNGGETLAKFITDNNLGKVWETERRTNPNSSHEIVVWVWAPDHAALWKWGQENGVV